MLPLSVTVLIYNWKHITHLNLVLHQNLKELCLFVVLLDLFSISKKGVLSQKYILVSFHKLVYVY